MPAHPHLTPYACSAHLPPPPGTAIVYIFELAPPGWEGRQSSFIVALCNVGVLLGNVIVMLREGGKAALFVPPEGACERAGAPSRLVAAA